jgi:hypothetical protein
MKEYNWFRGAVEGWKLSPASFSYQIAPLCRRPNSLRPAYNIAIYGELEYCGGKNTVEKGLTTSRAFVAGDDVNKLGMLCRNL